MGTILSSNKDYNRILAKSQKSIGVTKFDIPKNLQQYPLTTTLSIPVLLRPSQLNKQKPVPSNESLPSELNPTLIESNSSLIEQKQLMYRSTSYSMQPNFSTYNPSVNNDAIVLSRSVLNLNNHRHRHHNNYFSSYQPNQSIIERNGKQFLTESHERMEQRHVQIFDQTTGRMRLFEVTDYIPSKTIRAIKPHPQFQSQNRLLTKNPLPTSSSLNNRFPPPSMPYNRTESAQPPPPPPLPQSNLVDFKGLTNRQTVAQEFDLYHSGAAMPYNNNNNTNTSRAPLITQQSTDSNYTYSQPKAYNTSSISLQRPPNQYISKSFRPHSPTASEYSVNTSHINSKHSDDEEESDSEGIDPTTRSSTRSANNNNNNNRQNSDVAYRTLGGDESPPPIDPFKKSVRKNDSYYPKRPNMNNYSEPLQYNPSLQRIGASDYAPIPPGLNNQSNRNRYSQRQDSNAYDG